MRTKEFNDVLELQIDLCKRKLVEKAQEYATQDRLHNFKVAATLQGCTPIEALSGMMAKHTISIYDLCKETDEVPLHIWEEKITDHINYLILLKAVILDGMVYGQKEISNLSDALPMGNDVREKCFA